MWAAFLADAEAVRELIAAKAQLDIRNIYGDTALMIAAQTGSAEAVKELIAAMTSCSRNAGGRKSGSKVT